MVKSERRGLLVGKALYFFIFAALGILVPFLNVYYKGIGLSGTQIGVLATLGALVAIFSGPLWGLLCDRLGAARLLMSISVLGAILAVLGLSQQTQFLPILLFTALFNLFGAAIMPLLDSYNLALLGSKQAWYGRQRIWGTFGFLVSSALAGSVLERVGLQGVFWGYALMLGFYLIAVLALPPMPARLGRTTFKGFTQMIRQPAWILLGVCVILIMIANTAMLSFLGVTMKEMGASDVLIGRAWSIGALAEIPVMFYSTWLVLRLGARRLITLGFFFYGLRLLLYAIMPNPAWVVGINFLHGVSFGFYWIGGVSYVNEISPERLKATGQSMLATFFNIASLIGNPLNGWLYDTFGPGRMYSIAASLAWLATGLFAIGGRLLGRRQVESFSEDQTSTVSYRPEVR